MTDAFVTDGLTVGPVSGECDARFEPLRQAFAENFATRGEHGAAVCVAVNESVVADLWGGCADAGRTRPWHGETLVNVFSVGKAMAALCAHRLVGQGRLDVDDPVAVYWPEFAAAGKEEVTVRQVLSHQAGLPAVRRRLPEGGDAGLADDDGGAGRAGAMVEAGNGARLPRQHLRIPGWRIG